MLVELKSLKPNPMRDFTVDPIDDDVVEKLKQSIKEDGFWGGVVCRKIKSGDIQIAAGHHRIRAAIKAGIHEAEVYVSRDMDDAGLIRVYARENATQRGNSGTAQAGTVASAIKFLAKAIMTGSAEEFFRRRDIGDLKARLTSEQGMGRDVIVSFLEGVPGINDGAVQQQLVNLKSSGNYARIIAEVQQQIEEENREALKELKRQEAETAKRVAEQEQAEVRQREAEERRKEAAKAARAAKEETDRKRAAADQERAELAKQKADVEAKLAEKRRAESEKDLAKFDALRTARDTARKAVDKANGSERTFDFEGVATHLHNASQIDVFRAVACGPGMAPYLPVNKQAALAAHLVKLAKEQGAELSGRFIRENAIAMVLNVKGVERKLDRDEKEQLARRDWESKARDYQRDFARGAHTMLSAAIRLSEHCRDRPKGLTLQQTGEFNEAVKNVTKAIKHIERI